MLASGERPQPACYEIRVEGRLHEDWTVWFEGMTLSVETPEDGPATTIMCGPVSDRAALHGLLNRIRDLGLHLLLVRRVDRDG